ncbi:cyclic lactone autoinducer peptide [Paenibacillus sp. FSL R10-2734]
MKKNLARYASNVLATSAVVFAAILKPLLHSPEIPKELRK